MSHVAARRRAIVERGWQVARKEALERLPAILTPTQLRLLPRWPQTLLDSSVPLPPEQQGRWSCYEPIIVRARFINPTPALPAGLPTCDVRLLSGRTSTLSAAKLAVSVHLSSLDSHSHTFLMDRGALG